MRKGSGGFLGLERGREKGAWVFYEYKRRRERGRKKHIAIHNYSLREKGQKSGV